jgi:hypothetical protein
MMQRGSRASARPAEANSTAQILPKGIAHVMYFARRIARGVIGATCSTHSDAPSRDTDGNTKRAQIDNMISELTTRNETIAIKSQARKIQGPTWIGAEMLWKLTK